MTEPTHDPIQELVTAARRAQILDAATRVFVQKGLQRATIRDVAHEAGLSSGTIYNYFLNKEALILGVLDRVNQGQQRAADFAEALTADPAAFIRAYTAQRLTHLSAGSLDVLRVILAELLVNPALAQSYVAEIIAPTFAIGERPFAQWSEAGAVRTRDPRLATRTMAGAVLGLLLIRMLGDPYLEEHWGEVGDVLSDLMLHGLDVQEGAEREPSA